MLACMSGGTYMPFAVVRADVSAARALGSLRRLRAHATPRESVRARATRAQCHLHWSSLTVPPGLKTLGTFLKVSRSWELLRGP